jgi:hypothetical protein
LLGLRPVRWRAARWGHIRLLARGVIEPGAGAGVGLVVHRLAIEGAAIEPRGHRLDPVAQTSLAARIAFTPRWSGELRLASEAALELRSHLDGDGVPWRGERLPAAGLLIVASF